MTFLVGEKSAILRQILIKVEHHKIEASWFLMFFCIYNKLISHLSSPTGAHHTNIFSMFARLIGKLTHRTLAKPLDISIIGDIGDKIPSIIRGCHGTHGNAKHDKEGEGASPHGRRDLCRSNDYLGMEKEKRRASGF